MGFLNVIYMRPVEGTYDSSNSICHLPKYFFSFREERARDSMVTLFKLYVYRILNSKFSKLLYMRTMYYYV